MTRFLLLAAIALWASGTHFSGAATHTNWDGPACQMGAASFVVCSQEPAGPDDMGQCYVSHFADYIPDPIQLGLISICQAAKAALDAPPEERIDAIMAIAGRVTELTAKLDSYPDAAQNSGDAITSVGHDMQALGGSMIVYASQPDTWDDVVNNLETLITDAQVWGG